jgi:hypothetical protein
MHMDNMINQSNEYTTDLIRWINIQNQFMVKAIEALKEYVKNYNSAILMMAEPCSNIIKARNSSVSKMQMFMLSITSADVLSRSLAHTV